MDSSNIFYILFVLVGLCLSNMSHRRSTAVACALSRVNNNAPPLSEDAFRAKATIMIAWPIALCGKPRGLHDTIPAPCRHHSMWLAPANPSLWTLSQQNEVLLTGFVS
ncbi:hypothetical protein V1525DRAFT_404480 [Lipomyces kononenkoae]|uniref:Uncharacterized protein n=1 Tax=Lipomyces kononenkoae TaxID=34357 RepID=A0ACC3T0Y4_LIPKO